MYNNSITTGPMRGCDGGSKAHGAYMAPTEKLDTIHMVNRYPKPLATKAAYSHPLGEGYGIWTI